MKLFFIIQGVVATILTTIFFISELSLKIFFESYPVISFIVIINYVGVSVFIFGKLMVLLEEYYDEIIRILLIIFAIFITIQMVFFTLIYFEWVEFPYNDEKIILYFNLIFIMLFYFLFIFAKNRCPSCKSFETLRNTNKLHSRVVDIQHIYKGSGDLETSESVDICETLNEIHFECNNCSYESYSYELRRDDSSSVKYLSKEETKKYLKKYSSSDSIASMIIGGLAGVFFLS